MNPNNYGLVEMALSFGVGLLFCVWQLISLERAKKRTREKTTAQPPDQTS
jgi:hypothetical protein